MKYKKNKDFFLAHMNNLEVMNLYYDVKEEDYFKDDILYASQYYF